MHDSLLRFTGEKGIVGRRISSLGPLRLLDFEMLGDGCYHSCHASSRLCLVLERGPRVVRKLDGFLDGNFSGRSNRLIVNRRLSISAANVLHVAHPLGRQGGLGHRIIRVPGPFLIGRTRLFGSSVGELLLCGGGVPEAMFVSCLEVLYKFRLTVCAVGIMCLLPGVIRTNAHSVGSS